jgi:hypothetical protein
MAHGYRTLNVIATGQAPAPAKETSDPPGRCKRFGYQIKGKPRPESKAKIGVGKPWRLERAVGVRA